MKTLNSLLKLVVSWFSFRLTYYYLIHLVLLILFAWMAMGVVGLVMAFWVVLLWFSAWQRPMRPEFFLFPMPDVAIIASMYPALVMARQDS
mgnify:CR=1 FL=1